jgi:hypothetical protein
LVSARDFERALIASRRRTEYYACTSARMSAEELELSPARGRRDSRRSGKRVRRLLDGSVKRHRGEPGHTVLAAPAMSFKLTMGMSPF